VCETNRELVEEAVRLVRAKGAEHASPSDVRTACAAADAMLNRGSMSKAQIRTGATRDRN
jgi:hypothetical protein